MAGRPILNLVQPDGMLDPCAYWKLMSIMLYPNPTERNKRAAFMRRVRRAINNKKDFEPSPADSRATHQGMVAGEMLLRLLQLDEYDPPASINRVLPYVRAPLLYEVGVPLVGFPPMNKLEGIRWKEANKAKMSLPISVHRKNLFSYFRDFGSVAHFWSMLFIVHDVEDREATLPPAALTFENFRPDNERSLPRFISAAENLAQRASVIPAHAAVTRHSSTKKKREGVLPLARTWDVLIPKPLREQLRIPIPKIYPSLEKVLSKTSKGDTE